jgi:hypothetical protein
LFQPEFFGLKQNFKASIMSKLSLVIKNNFYLLALWLLPQIALAQNFGLDETAKEAGLKTSSTLTTRSGQIIGSLLSLVGAIFLILMIYGGIMWMTAAGNDKQVLTAKSIITRAVIGLVVIFSAYAITAFLGSSLS